MAEQSETKGLSRRGLLGLGATAATVAAGATVFGATGAAAAPGGDVAATSGAGGSAESVALSPSAITPVAPLGTRSMTYDWTSFVPYGTAQKQPGTTTGTYLGVTTSGGSNATVPLHVPVGAALAKVELVSYTTTLASYSANLVLSRLATDDYVALNSMVAAGTGQLLATYTLPTPRVIGIGETLWLDISGIDTTKYFMAATVHYLPVGEFIPINPSRVYDSRQAEGALAKGQTRTISVANQIASAGGATNVVLAGARAISYNVTATATVGPFGYLTIVPGGGSVSGPSSINWDRADATLANGLQVGLDSSRQITVGCEGVDGVSTQFIIDVVGYYR
jgi:hypothetical protein